MAYIQGGIEGILRYEGRDKVASEIRRDPYNIFFYSTTVVGSSWQGRISDLPHHLTITIWGPHPVHDRQWRLTVKRGSRGFVLA